MPYTLTVDVCLPPDHRRRALERDVRAGLTGHPKWLPPLWFYDDRGSDLFDQITRLPEYYPTRAERSILDEHAADIVGTAGADTLVELGSGTSEKTRLLLDAMEAAGTLRAFMPFDVSEATLRSAAASIGERYAIPVHAVVGDFSEHLGAIPRDGRRLVAFLGSTIGNLRPHERQQFLSSLRATLGPADRFLLGTDLVKDRDRLVAAYDDAAGVTAEFNRNVLAVLNAEAGGQFDLDRFAHLAVWNDEERWIEMRLRSLEHQRVPLTDLDVVVTFERGEELLTEISAKFTVEQVEAELMDAGFTVDGQWLDSDKDFMLTLARPSG